MLSRTMSDLLTLRKQFPVTENYIYFNHAAVSPLPSCTAEAMRTQISDVEQNGVHGFGRWMADYDGLRRAAANMIHCSPGEIAITKNTSEGLSAVANGLDWKANDVVVCLEEDFPANFMPWRELRARRGVRLRRLEMVRGGLDLEQIDAACDGARLLAVSYVHFLTGFRLDLNAVGEICRRRNCIFVVDAVQGMGPFPIDVKQAGIHALSASGHKWLLGPEGCAVFYIDAGFMPQVEPIEIGWTNTQGFENYQRDGELRVDAGRYECGTLNSVGCAGMRASIEFLNEIGSEQASTHINSLVERFLAGAEQKGYASAAIRTTATGSGVVSIRKDGVDSVSTVRMLLENRISTAPRFGWIRVAPHVYNTTDEIDQLIKLLP